MTTKRVYLFSLGMVLLVSAYPIYMGIRTMIDYLSMGAVDAINYQKYIIPYTPICIALIMSTMLMPVFRKFCKKWSLLFVSVFGIALFFIFELLFEQIKVIVDYIGIAVPLESWQLSLCRGLLPDEIAYFEKVPVFADNDPSFKVHFYIIAIVIILAVINVIHGFSKMYKEQNFDKKKPLYAQLVSIAVFIGLCIWACFTAFYRKVGVTYILPVSAILMSIFFVVFGVTFGVYIGCIFYGKKNLYSLILPSISAALLTTVMYIGELILMGGVLFKYGSGFLFEPVFACPFAPIDFLVIIISGIAAYAVLNLIAKKT